MIRNKRLAIVSMAMCCTSVLQAQNISGTWHGQLDLGVQKINIVIHADPDNCSIDSPDQGARGIKATLNHSSADSLSMDVPTIGASFAGKLRSGRLVGVFRQQGHALPLTLEPGALHRNRPQTPRPPFPYTTEEVTFINPQDSALLAGTLTLPENFSDAKSCPVVLMVSGSGLQNRDEELMDHRPFAVLADHLARNGIASLRYDDRSCGLSKGDASKATTATFMQDAAAGIQLLRAKRGFSHVGVLGHSEGGTVAFMLAARKQADFVVTLGAPGVAGDSILLSQQQALLKQKGANLSLNIQQVRQSVKAQANDWLNFFIEYDPATDIAEVVCPALVLNGGKDMQVAPSQNTAAIRRHMPKDTPCTIKVYDGLNHLMQHCTTGMVDEYANIEETLADEVLDDITEWIKKLPLK